MFSAGWRLMQHPDATCISTLIKRGNGSVGQIQCLGAIPIGNDNSSRILQIAWCNCTIRRKLLLEGWHLSEVENSANDFSCNFFWSQKELSFSKEWKTKTYSWKKKKKVGLLLSSCWWRHKFSDLWNTEVFHTGGKKKRKRKKKWTAAS